jgi:phosphoribosylamine--glycine ligase
MMVTAGNAIGTVTGCGKTVQMAKRDAYEHLEQLEIPNSPMYRTDIGDRLESQLPILQKYGYCTSWIY